VPGLVDGHTHPVWAGDRVAEFAMKLAGATYMQVSSLPSELPFLAQVPFTCLKQGV
jgi:imidazolonepropionase